jgi:hypothetical protein
LRKRDAIIALAAHQKAPWQELRPSGSQKRRSQRCQALRTTDKLKATQIVSVPILVSLKTAEETFRALLLMAWRRFWMYSHCGNSRRSNCCAGKDLTAY